MFKLPKQNNKQAKSGERVDFRFSNFQALQEVTGSCCGNILLQKCKVPKGWDRLSLSIICVETGKTIAKLGKTLVKNGSCQWPETLLESVWILQDDSSLELEESLYKFVVSMGSARSGILGEGTINLASYVGSRLSSPVLLPLKKCNQGTTLQVKIHCLTPRNKFRDESKSSGSNMKEQDLDHDITSKSNESDNLSAGSDGLQSTQDIVSNSGPSKFEIKFEQNDTPKSTNKYTNFNRVPQKLNQSQELLVDRLHSDFESEGENGIAYSVEVDYLARIQLLENKLAEALEANKKYKIQLQRFKTEERKGHSPSSRKPDGDSEMVKRFERTKTLLETELKDIRERYFQMSLKYAEVEAQREDLVMKLKAAKSGKKWFS